MSEQLKDANHVRHSQSGSRLIESAPMDGTTLLLFCPQGDGNASSTYRVTAGFWESWVGEEEKEPHEWWYTLDGGFSEETMMPTHWMPLPDRPELSGM